MSLINGRSIQGRALTEATLRVIGVIRVLRVPCHRAAMQVPVANLASDSTAQKPEAPLRALGAGVGGPCLELSGTYQL